MKLSRYLNFARGATLAFALLNGSLYTPLTHAADVPLKGRVDLTLGEATNLGWGVSPVKNAAGKIQAYSLSGILYPQCTKYFQFGSKLVPEGKAFFIRDLGGDDEQPEGGVGCMKAGLLSGKRCRILGSDGKMETDDSINKGKLVECIRLEKDESFPRIPYGPGSARIGFAQDPAYQTAEQKKENLATYSDFVTAVPRMRTDAEVIQNAIREKEETRQRIIAEQMKDLNCRGSEDNLNISEQALDWLHTFAPEKIGGERGFLVKKRANDKQMLVAKVASAKKAAITGEDADTVSDSIEQLFDWAKEHKSDRDLVAKAITQIQSDKLAASGGSPRTYTEADGVIKRIRKEIKPLSTEMQSLLADDQLQIEGEKCVSNARATGWTPQVAQECQNDLVSGGNGLNSQFTRAWQKGDVVAMQAVQNKVPAVTAYLREAQSTPAIKAALSQQINNQFTTLLNQPNATQMAGQLPGNTGTQGTYLNFPPSVYAGQGNAQAPQQSYGQGYIPGEMTSGGYRINNSFRSNPVTQAPFTSNAPTPGPLLGPQ